MVRGRATGAVRGSGAVGVLPKRLGDCAESVTSRYSDRSLLAGVTNTGSSSGMEDPSVAPARKTTRNNFERFSQPKRSDRQCNNISTMSCVALPGASHPTDFLL